MASGNPGAVQSRSLLPSPLAFTNVAVPIERQVLAVQHDRENGFQTIGSSHFVGSFQSIVSSDSADREHLLKSAGCSVDNTAFSLTMRKPDGPPRDYR